MGLRLTAQGTSTCGATLDFNSRCHIRFQLAVPHRTSTHSTRDLNLRRDMGLRLAVQGTSTCGATLDFVVPRSWAEILWRRESRTLGLKTPLDKIIYSSLFYCQKYDICQKKIVIDHFFQSRSYQVTEEIPRDQSRMPCPHFPSPAQR